MLLDISMSFSQETSKLYSDAMLSVESIESDISRSFVSPGLRSSFNVKV